MRLLVGVRDVIRKLEGTVMNSEHGTKMLRETLRLAAARAEPTAYPVGARVQMHSWNNTQVWTGTIMSPAVGTLRDERRVLFDEQGPWAEWSTTTCR